DPRGGRGRLGQSLADAALGGLPGAAALQFRRHGEHRRPAGRRGHRGLVPRPLHAQVPLGPSRHRRHPVEERPGKRLDRKAGAFARALRAAARRTEMTSVDFYFNAADTLQVACRIAAKAMTQGSRLLIYSPEPEMASRIDKLLWTWPAIA